MHMHAPPRFTRNKLEGTDILVEPLKTKKTNHKLYVYQNVLQIDSTHEYFPYAVRYATVHHEVFKTFHCSTSNQIENFSSHYIIQLPLHTLTAMNDKYISRSLSN